ncbi:putative bifunctional diguanylate cyclase/phosphodiesterase [Nannocystis punicea]|uniref:EAL domain-containing protein n=1 Tax=Nannocystis punicea TaxID=2995304 RepID=A0ABY7H3M3_9BACT|nr:bifunctional diguanylate cyclase/phosphodiesterase [Nannocystis poenicansa]WAS93854.1 EAL domain-containing protein [Nannocystis poenicansa]
MPAFFEPAFACPDTLADLWHAARHAYLDCPLPAVFKELTLLLTLRRAGAGLVEHALALTRLGLAPAAVLAALDDPRAFINQLPAARDALREQNLHLETWPEDPVLHDMLMRCGLAFAADPRDGADGRAALAVALTPALYTRWTALVAYARSRAAWFELHPDLAQRVDPPLIETHAWLLREAPGLARHFGDPAVGARPLVAPALLRLIDAVPTGILQFDARGAIVMSNTTAQRLLGHGAEALAALTIEDLERGALRDDGHPLAPGSPLRRCLEQGKPQPPITVGLRTAKGELLWTNLTAVPLEDDGQGAVMVTLVDISERRKIERALQESEIKYQLLVEASDVFLLCFDRDGVIFHANELIADLFSSTVDSLIGKSLGDLAPDMPELAEAYLARFAQVMESGIGVSVEEMIEVRGKNGWFASTVVPLRDFDGAVTGVQVVARDITRRRRAEIALRAREERSRHDSLHDPLTRLPNRQAFMEKLEAALQGVRQGRAAFAVLCLDLDRFKNINDSLGHSIGDRLLISFARLLQDCVGPDDLLARLSGDEFGVLLPNVQDASDAIRVADRILGQLKQPLSLRDQEVYTSISVGITWSALGYERTEDILRDADTAMHRAKRRGKSRYELFDADMHAEAVAQLTLESDLRRAIERGEFEVYYQPVIDLVSGQISGFEALLRWNHPTRGLVLPGEFIGCAEETGLIIPIGEWVLREACGQMQRWHAKYPHREALSISVNLSGKQFAQPALIAKALHESMLVPSSLKLEITESVIMEDPKTASELIEQLRLEQVHSYVDDFGTGYSSLSYLHRFPMSALKIDRSFISNIGPDGENAEIVRTIVTLAHNLGMSVIAEGVETRAQLDLLAEMGCEFGQGYYFSRPVSSGVAESMISRDCKP